MTQLFGIDKNKKVLPAYLASEDMFTGGELAVRQIRAETDIDGATVVTGALGVGVQVATIYTVPANKIFELLSASVQYSSGGAATFVRLQMVGGGITLVIASVNSIAINDTFSYAGRIFMKATWQVKATINVTGANANFALSCVGVLHPNP